MHLRATHRNATTHFGGHEAKSIHEMNVSQALLYGKKLWSFISTKYQKLISFPMNSGQRQLVAVLLSTAAKNRYFPEDTSFAYFILPRLRDANTQADRWQVRGIIHAVLVSGRCKGHRDHRDRQRCEIHLRQHSCDSSFRPQHRARTNYAESHWLECSR
jgi:hypothetical protein